MGRVIGWAALGCLVALPAFADSPLQGQWKVVNSADPAYVAFVRIDADGRATYTAPLDNGKPANFRGYVANVTGLKAEIVLTDGTQVVKAYCAVQSSDVLQCRNIRGDESPSNPYTLARITRQVPKLWRP